MGELGAGAQLALSALRLEPTAGIPSWMLHVIEHAHLERRGCGRTSDQLVRHSELTHRALRSTRDCESCTEKPT